MDLETENRLAALLMDEARRLRREAEKEGVSAYLHQPHVRGRPNSRFLTATVLGVQQANRVVEVNEMWRAREKEIELDRKRRHTSVYTTNDKSDGDRRYHPGREKNGHNHPSSSRFEEVACSTEDEGLKDEELEKFLYSRVKRGRGAVGSRMDEPGRYPASRPLHQDKDITDDVRIQEQWERRVLGPEKPSYVRSTNELPGDHVSLARDKKERDSKKHRRDKDGEHSKKKSEKKEKAKKHKYRYNRSP